jgi:hypothetical protein
MRILPAGAPLERRFCFVRLYFEFQHGLGVVRSKESITSIYPMTLLNAALLRIRKPTREGCLEAAGDDRRRPAVPLESSC